ncbi:tetratricopeptide repeat protein [Limibacter armeniacum]|uniref:tetratricopeptide repeat protein n=1 Tax=Limibacter armeniacum TaxID=466084 RepID=UPI002FE5D0B5
MSTENTAIEKDKTAVLQSLKQEIQTVEPDNHIHEFLSLLDQYRLTIKELTLESTVVKPKAPTPNDALIQTPQQLIARFTEIYDCLDTRFDLCVWQAAVKSLKENTNTGLQVFCIHIIEFLLDHCYLTSDTFQLLNHSFPFDSLFETSEWNELEKNTEKSYAFVKSILNKGNFEQDLLIETIPVERYVSEQFDAYLATILHSSGLLRNGQNQQALQVLSSIPAENRPLVVWQRIIQVFYKASMLEGNERAKEIFPQFMDNALAYFPNDDHLLYLQGAFRLETRPTQESKTVLITLLKKHPQQDKLLFLLGRCYLNLKQYENAYAIFKRLVEIYPINLEYVSFSTLALDGVLSQPILVDHHLDLKGNYIKRMLLQLELYIHDLIEVPEELEKDPDIEALKMYADLQDDQQDKGLDISLTNALHITQDKNVKLFLFNKLMDCYPNFDDILGVKDLILSFLEAYPNEFPTVYAAAGLYYAQGNYEEAYDFYDRASQLNPQHIYTFQGMARSALHMEEYDKAIAASRVFQYERKYDRSGYYCMGKSYYNMGVYDKAYECFKWMVQLVRPQPSPHDQYVFVASLSKYLSQLDEEGRKAFEHEIENAISLFESLGKDEDFDESNEGRWAYLHTAMLCEYVAMHENGLETVNHTISLWQQDNISIPIEAASLKARLLGSLFRFEEAKDFLNTHLEYLQQEPVDKEQIEEIIQMLNHINEQQEEDSELSRKLRVLMQKSDADPAEWRHVYVQLMYKAMMGKEHKVMIKAGLHYFSHYLSSDPDDIFMAFWTGNTYKELGDWETAKPYFERCLAMGELFPGESPNLVTMAGMTLRSNS